MKKRMLLLLSAIAFAFTACNEEESVQNGVSGNSVSGEPALLSISVSGKTESKTRTTGSEGVDESNVNDGIIYIFDGGGNVVKKEFLKTADFTGNVATKTVATTTAAKSISVLLNIGIADSTTLAGTKYDVPTINQLEALTETLTNETTGTALQQNDNLIMSGVSTVPLTFSGTPKTGTSNVIVSRIASRIKVYWTFAPSSTYTNKIRLKGAVLLNVASASQLFGASLFPSSGVKYIQGFTPTTFNAFPATTFKPAFGDIISNTTEFVVSPFAVPQAADNHFYVFENNATYPTIVALVADYNENGIDVGANQTKCYPVFINRAITGGQDGSMTIIRNNQYNVNITVKGVGVDNPYEPVDPTSLDVTITVAPWNLEINVNQTFE